MSILIATGGSGSPHTTASLWFENPIQSIAVTMTGPFSGTADGACPVAFRTNSAAFVKPRVTSVAQNLLVAREKIASDLGYLLGLPVAPVVVRVPEPENQWPHHSAMSLVTLPSARLWAAGGDLYLAVVAITLERLRVFWTWIGDTDHNGHGGNLLFSVRGAKVDLCAIDHAYSLCRQCHADPLAVGSAVGYGTAALLGHEEWARSQIAAIASLDWSKIEHIVRRLSPIITGDEQQRILSILERRRDQLAALLTL